jgi:hypothetical protein
MNARILAIALCISTGALAIDPGFNSDAYLAANPDVRAAGYTAYQHINMIDGAELAARLASTRALVAKSNSAAEIQVMFCDCSAFTEDSTIQNMAAWQLGLQTGRTTARAMVKDGWRLQNTVSLNARQYLFVFLR